MGVLAVGAGLSVAGLYYNQPMLGRLAEALGTTPERIGFIPTATQLGYAGGIVLSAPLGDKLDRRRVMVTKGALLCAALVAAGAARDVVWMAAASMAIGLSATLAQDFVPAAAAIATPATRGKTVGTVMTGLLLGILLSRVVSGAVTAYVSWRIVFFGAAGLVAGLTLACARLLPAFPPEASARDASYGALLASMLSLIRRVAPLRRATVAQALLAAGFSGFWSTLALGLAAPPFAMSSMVAGAFGIAGAAGAIAAPIAGGIADRRGPVAVVRFGALLTALAFAAMAAWGTSLLVLVAGTILFDLGTQAALIAHQTIVYAQDPAARSRLNAVLVSGMFVGMSSGAFAASRIFARWGFPAVLTMGAALALAALALRLAPERAAR